MQILIWYDYIFHQKCNFHRVFGFFEIFIGNVWTNNGLSVNNDFNENVFFVAFNCRKSHKTSNYAQIKEITLGI